MRVSQSASAVNLGSLFNAISVVEIAIVIGKGGKNIKLKDAMNHVAGYGEWFHASYTIVPRCQGVSDALVALILDMSATNYHRDTGSGEDRTLPLCKGFDTFNPIGRFIDRSELPDPHDVVLSLEVCLYYPLTVRQDADGLLDRWKDGIGGSDFESHLHGRSRDSIRVRGHDYLRWRHRTHRRRQGRLHRWTWK